MTPEKNHRPEHTEPRGFGQHTRGLSGEYAHEQGWGLAVEERTKGPRNPNGGNDYDYGAQDFGDEAVDVASAQVASPKQNDQKR